MTSHTLLILFIVFAEGFCAGLSIVPDHGTWYANGNCPKGRFIKSVRLPVVQKHGMTAGSRRQASVEIDPVGYSDETGLKNLEILCANTGIFNNSVMLESYYALDEDEYFSYLTCPGNTYATSYSTFKTTSKGMSISKSWYLGSHRFADKSASSLRLFCGHGLKVEYNTPTSKQSDVYQGYSHSVFSCERSLFDDADWGIMCKFLTSTQQEDASCCSSLPKYFVYCGGNSRFPEIQECDNTKGLVHLSCDFERLVGVEYSGLDNEDNTEAETQRISDISSLKNLGITLNTVGPFLLAKYNYDQRFSKSSMPQTISEGKIYGKLSYLVPAGHSLRVSQLVGKCDLFQMRTDYFVVELRNSERELVERVEDAYPLSVKN